MLTDDEVHGLDVGTEVEGYTRRLAAGTADQVWRDGPTCEEAAGEAPGGGSAAPGRAVRHPATDSPRYRRDVR